MKRALLIAPLVTFVGIGWFTWSSVFPVVVAEEEKFQGKDFQKTIVPFLKDHCIKCHGPKRESGKLTLQTLATVSSKKDLETWKKVLDRLRKGEMPPEKEPRPAKKDLEKVVGWISKELEKIEGKEVAQESLDGNYVDHDALFNSPEVKPLDAPPRIWRMGPYVYDGFVERLTRNRIRIANPFSGSSKTVFKDWAEAFTIDESTASQLIRNARAIVKYQTNFKFEKGRIRGSNSREFGPLFDPKNEPTREQMETAIRRQFEFAVLRDPTKAEMDTYVDLMKQNIKDAGRETGVRTTLAAILLMPEILYRSERGKSPPDEKGRVRLTPREIAFAISYSLTDREPDRKLLEAMEKGKLDTKEGVAGEVKRILEEERIRKPRILRFFQEYFGYREALNVFKDQKDFKGHHAVTLVSDTDQLIEYFLEQDRNVFEEMLTTNKSFVNYRWDRRKKRGQRAQKRPVEEAYNLKEWPKRQPADLPKDERSGILTQPSWLVAHSVCQDNHAIHRGKWIRERLLGGTIPDVPITVDAQLPDEPEKTLRERMRVTHKEYCWNCHKRMNPLGLTFEIYDHFGRHRETELDQPVDASGWVDLTGDKSIEGDTKDCIEMLRRLAKSERVKQVFIRHFFRYMMGRNETLGDARTLREAYAAYVNSQGSMKALIVSIMTSESFLYRVPKSSQVSSKK